MNIMNSDNKQSELSAEGCRRRAGMLVELQQEVLLVKRARVRRNAFRLVAPVVVMLTIGWTTTTTDSQRKTEMPGAEHAPFVNTLDSNAEYAFNEQPSFEGMLVSLKCISDEELLDTLTEMGYPSAIGRVGDKEILISQIEF